MENEFVTYEQALALKELGFDESCFAVYSEYDKTRVYDEDAIREGVKIQAPLKQQAFRFFRKKHGLHSYIKGMFPVFQYYIDYDTDKWKNYKQISYYSEMSYEEAEEAYLNKLIEICKNK